MENALDDGWTTPLGSALHFIVKKTVLKRLTYRSSQLIVENAVTQWSAIVCESGRWVLPGWVNLEENRRHASTLNDTCDSMNPRNDSSCWEWFKGQMELCYASHSTNSHDTYCRFRDDVDLDSGSLTYLSRWDVAMIRWFLNLSDQGGKVNGIEDVPTTTAVPGAWPEVCDRRSRESIALRALSLPLLYETTHSTERPGVHSVRLLVACRYEGSWTHLHQSWPDSETATGDNASGPKRNDIWSYANSIYACDCDGWERNDSRWRISEELGEEDTSDTAVDV